MVKTASLHAKITGLVNTYDPIHLLSMGCPEDEYNGEVKRIIRGLKKASNPEQLCNLLHGIFVDMFDERLAGPKENYQQLAIDLFKLK
ncbi:hypothetical protein A2867_00815 [Candidatus Daviesbacteria bacterium RIFCSPHIGHO2_01_FULL_40_11]|uniref:Uncharacterized protein n=1 Tax=Candidatus Daviesbacteria bacterium RIFCSPHIGHO2_01_FULL_40_11 TaxID=1797762 RepID=A0A1F5JLK1_9BACT|nr:MAG: hypothetical protein A2867_00815 [Candidatus Daviesbacteria bacterium RIFCSPHIGHO2_01_FULL_40_11]